MKFSMPSSSSIRKSAFGLSTNAKIAILSLLSFLVLYNLFANINSNENRAGLFNYGQRATRVGSIDDILNSTLGFQKILVINMPDRVDRRDQWTLTAPYANITFEYIDGVVGANMNVKAYPAGWNTEHESAPTLGCARSHLDAAERMVRERISSALILESDADWDIMLRQQLQEYARGSRYLQGFSEESLTHSPYGDDWDLSWLGHCGITADVKTSQDYWVIDDDPTVLPRSMWGYRKSKTIDTKPDALNKDFKRVVFKRPQKGLCTAGYALSLRGAEKFLLHFSVKPQAPGVLPADDNLRVFCEKEMSAAKCLAPFPPLFEQYKAPGSLASDSDRETKDGFRWEPRTNSVIFPLRPNLDRLINGEEVLYSQYGNESVLLGEINHRTYQMPRGRPIWVSWEEFRS